MKKLILSAIVSAVFMLASLPAKAGLQVIPLTTNQVAASTATNFASIGSFFLGNTTDATLALSCLSTATNGAVTATFSFDVSADFTLWTTNGFNATVTLPANTATNVQTTTTNLIAGQRWPFWRLGYVSNSVATGTITNLTAKMFTKDGF